jgi:ATP-binding cassette subfamily F protein uup
VVSHDRYFLDRICDQIVAFEDDGVFVQPGNYSYYLEKKKERDARKSSFRIPAITATAQPAAGKTKSARPRKLSFKEQRELEGMEDAILKLENRVAEVEATLNDPTFHATRSRETPTLVKELETGKAEIARLYDRWQELASIGQEA